jgi:hypothetical protein
MSQNDVIELGRMPETPVPPRRRAVPTGCVYSHAFTLVLADNDVIILCSVSVSRKSESLLENPVPPHRHAAPMGCVYSRAFMMALTDNRGKALGRG